MIPGAIRRAFLPPLSAAVLMLIAASDLHAAPSSEANTITLKDFHFAPTSLTISAGTTVIWKNLDGEPHTVVSDAGLFRSGGLDQDDSFTFKFDKPGTYRFICSIHPQMMGTIIVK
jgi:plastocyanin